MVLLADQEGSDQTAQMHSLIWAFTVYACPEGTYSLAASHNDKIIVLGSLAQGLEIYIYIFWLIELCG